MVDRKGGLSRTSDPVLGKVLAGLAELTRQAGSQQKQGSDGNCENRSSEIHEGILLQ